MNISDIASKLSSALDRAHASLTGNPLWALRGEISYYIDHYGWEPSNPWLRELHSDIGANARLLRGMKKQQRELADMLKQLLTPSCWYDSDKRQLTVPANGVRPRISELFRLATGVALVAKDGVRVEISEEHTLLTLDGHEFIIRNCGQERPFRNAAKELLASLGVHVVADDMRRDYIDPRGEGNFVAECVGGSWRFTRSELTLTRDASSGQLSADHVGSEALKRQ